jgi:hypothetical protein
LNCTNSPRPMIYAQAQTAPPADLDNKYKMQLIYW